MSRLRDILFVPSPTDLKFLKDMLLKSGWTAKQIEDKMRTDYSFFVRRVRRVVPRPEVLVREYDDLVNLFADVKYAKTGESRLVLSRNVSPRHLSDTTLRQNVLQQEGLVTLQSDKEQAHDKGVSS